MRTLCCEEIITIFVNLGLVGLRSVFLDSGTPASVVVAAPNSTASSSSTVLWLLPDKWTIHRRQVSTALPGLLDFFLISCGLLNEKKIPHQLMYLNTWFPVGGAVAGDGGWRAGGGPETFRMKNIVGVSKPSGKALRIFSILPPPVWLLLLDCGWR